MLNIFKKNKKQTNSNKTKIESILCIPGLWKDRNEIITSIVKCNPDEYILVGMVLQNLKTKKCFTVEVYERDKQLKEAFKYAGMVNRVTDEFLNQIGKHNLVVFLIGETGNFEDAKSIAEAGNAILNAGGLGIKVETAGKAFTKEHWNDLITNFEEINLYQLFVIDSINDGKGKTYSCGMHNIGLKDTVVYGEEFQTSVDLITIFSYYQIIDKPVIYSNQTFSSDKDSPVFKIENEEDQPYEGDKLFWNPFGMWKLEKNNQQVT